jgi:endonuclease YncB( thermonuclease family)
MQGKLMWNRFWALGLFTCGIGATAMVSAFGSSGLQAATAPVNGVQSACGVKATERSKVVKVIDGDSLELTGGRIVLLSEVLAPRLASARAPQSKPSPGAVEAKIALEALTLNKEISFPASSTAKDKKGRLIAHVFSGNEWVQGALVDRGLVRVSTWPDNHACAQALLTRERAARLAKKGIWANAAYAVRGPGLGAGDIGGFQLVQGTVRNVANVHGRVFLNFGEDYKTDFTVHIKPGDVQRFSVAGMNLEALQGRQVRVRGWVRERNGPVINASHPEQIELLN